jgi:hypothetical protein
MLRIQLRRTSTRFSSIEMIASSAQLFSCPVRLNGTEIAKLGVGERVIGDGTVGMNTLEAKLGGLCSIGTNTPTVPSPITISPTPNFAISVPLRRTGHENS